MAIYVYLELIHGVVVKGEPSEGRTLSEDVDLFRIFDLVRVQVQDTEVRERRQDLKNVSKQV